ncbi:MAG: ATP-binding cassette domain-containing protein, partial [Chloroflexi bacterium]|nr:ATP-binding cassette domain-containing protein [Chloroflexota bacterium]
MLQLTDVHTYYGESHILRGVSLGLEAGEAVGLLGRNGAGKTTTISSIVGFTPPRAGSIRLGERELVGLPSHRIARLGIGLVPQGRRVFPDLT